MCVSYVRTLSHLKTYHLTKMRLFENYIANHSAPFKTYTHTPYKKLANHMVAIVCGVVLWVFIIKQTKQKKINKRKHQLFICAKTRVHFFLFWWFCALGIEIEFFLFTLYIISSQVANYIIWMTFQMKVQSK